MRDRRNASAAPYIFARNHEKIRDLETDTQNVVDNHRTEPQRHYTACRRIYYNENLLMHFIRKARDAKLELNHTLVIMFRARTRLGLNNCVLVCSKHCKIMFCT